MKKKLCFVVALIAAVLPTIFVSAAVNFDNPAGGFLIDLTRQGQTNTFPGLIMYFIKLSLGIVGLLSIAFIIYGGFQYVTSRGDEELASAGKKTLINAIIGLTIVILSYVIVAVIVNALSGRV